METSSYAKVFNNKIEVGNLKLHKGHFYEARL